MSSTLTETDKSPALIKQGYNLLLNKCLKDEVEDTDEVNSYTQLIIKLIYVFVPYSLLIY